MSCFLDFFIGETSFISTNNQFIIVIVGSVNYSYTLTFKFFDWLIFSEYIGI